ncbi:hypothetical protein [uncultured Roseobacter sp.]|uniref:hypothetical protein n=1 Tax=uncultured Roseobacter sp. TaxID=114847 RepID=UPI00263668D6|nr:hypothetical protein [uncultured Roseobacter sp.]
MIKYALAVALLAVLGLGAKLQFTLADLETVTAEKSALEVKLTGCTARAANLIEDKESDETIDLLPDDDLRLVPDEWLLAPTPGDR